MPRVLVLDRVIEEMKKEGHDYNYTQWQAINFDSYGLDFILKKYEDEKNGYDAEIYAGENRQLYANHDDEEKAANAVLNKFGYYYENGMIHCMFQKDDAYWEKLHDEQPERFDEDGIYHPKEEEE